MEKQINKQAHNLFSEGTPPITDEYNTANLNKITESRSYKNSRNEKVFYSSGFPQLTIIGYGVISTSGAFNENDIKHQPQMWGCSKTSTGTYTVTHNLGHLKYIVLLGDAQLGQAVAGNKTTTTFEIGVETGAGARVDKDVSFIVYGLP